jgi:hypothetical protein
VRSGTEFSCPWAIAASEITVQQINVRNQSMSARRASKKSAKNQTTTSMGTVALSSPKLMLIVI